MSTAESTNMPPPVTTNSNNSSAGMYMTESGEDEPRFHLCESSSVFARVSVGLTLLAIIFHIVAIATPFWVVVNFRGDMAYHDGLWMGCKLLGMFTIESQWVCLGYSSEHHLDAVPNFLKASQGLAILGLILLVAILFLLTLYTILPKLAGRKKAALVSLCLAIIAGTFIIIAAIVYGAEYPRPQDDLGYHELRYSYGFVFEFLVGVMCYGLSALIIVDMRKSMLISSLRFF